MLLLALDTATRVCSVALGDERTILAEYSLNNRRTHSQDLLPLIISLLESSGIHKNQLTGLAVNVGPGSFTGIRIGLATAKGFCQGLDIPAVGVIGLEALAGAAAFCPALICPVLDARRNQLYTALYRGGKDELQVLHPAAALTLPELLTVLNRYDEDIIFLGDALLSFSLKLSSALGKRYREPPVSLQQNRAALILQRGLEIWEKKGGLPPVALEPFYLRLPEAERRLRAKRRGGK
ncbi:MAG: tRNA (adenosine(37)-N6)-threonylcarbamoyltransferase complex dimerization subunit type 1 TsaB [Firmicutes bacterium]|nr:tRNA (adenosine(37)-N6)-threonylcarbamoyltransferase complex dimerization subunit type 1 TsaB [Bacillota bacterium]